MAQPIIQWITLACALALCAPAQAQQDPTQLDEQILGITAPPPPQAEPSRPGTHVMLRGLDKLSGRTETFEAVIGQAAMYERLRIEVKACNVRTAAHAPESNAFLQIFDTKYDPEKQSFSGWMFASSPALSAMDHPRYDVWILSCEGAT